MRFAALVPAMLMLTACGHFMEASPHHESYVAQLKQQAAASKDPGKICKSMKVTGSNMPQRVCSTADEWAAYDKANRAAAEVFDEDRRANAGQDATEGN